MDREALRSVKAKYKEGFSSLPLPISKRLRSKEDNQSRETSEDSTMPITEVNMLTSQSSSLGNTTIRQATLREQHEIWVITPIPVGNGAFKDN
ncbi:unnamed protein product [Ilex paraguariensis]|uniref:Uncharacterized protein n=1 Tax=Ilex paraguariensis TaxID=185542 RepID=A0ABC8SDJ7_9AQUA